MESITRRRRTAAQVLSVLGVLYVVPLVLSGRAYVDDLGRTMLGYTQWAPNGRPLADVIMLALNFGQPLTDLSPLPQILGVALVLVASYLAFTAIDLPELPPFAVASAAALLLYNPFLLENMSYKFDALTMSAAILLAVFAVLPREWNPFVSLLVGSLCLVGSFGLYQAAPNLFIGLTVMIAVIKAYRGEPGKQILQYVAMNSAIILIGFAIYLISTRYYLLGSGYAGEHSATLPVSLSGFLDFVATISASNAYIVRAFSRFQLLVLLLAMVLSFGFVTFVATRNLVQRRFAWWSAPVALFTLLSPVVIFLSGFGLSSVLKSPIYDPRLFIGVGAILMTVTLFAAIVFGGVARLGRAPMSSRVTTYITSAVAAVPLIVCMSITYAFGAAQAAQREFDYKVVNDIGAGITEVGGLPGVPFVVDGVIPYAPRAAIQIAKYPILRELVPRYLSEDWWWGVSVMNYYGWRVTRPDQATRALAIEQATGLSSGYDTDLFAVFNTGTAIVVRFRNAP